MKLFIDSTDNKKTIVGIGEHRYIREVATPRDQDVFGLLVSSLKSENMTIKDITEIEVNVNSGSFTGTRIGVSIANALGFALKIPVNGQMHPVTPTYSQEPNITTPKPR